MSCESNWPSPLWIEAFDPYPWHGLVYSQDFTLWLQPSQGRAPLPLPERPPNYYEFQRHVEDPTLWDIGNPDPPPSQCLFDAGGESLGRCLLEVTAPEARVAGVTRRLLVRWVSGRPGELLITENGNEVASAPFDHAAMLAGAEVLLNPVNGSAMSPMARMDQIDRSPDGTRRLMAAVGVYSLNGQGYNFIAGIVVATIGEDGEGALTLSCDVEATALDCLGTFTYERDSARSSASLSPANGNLELVPIPADYSTGAGLYPFPHVGSMTDEAERVGRVLGGWLTPTGVELVRCDYTRWTRQVSDPAGSRAEKWQPSDTSYNRQFWRVDYTREREYTVRIYTGAAEVALSGRDDRGRGAAVESDGIFGPPIYVGSVEYSDSESVPNIGSSSTESVETGVAIVDDFARLTSITATAPPDTSKPPAPEPPTFGSSVVVSVTTNCQKARALVGRTATQQYMTGALTPLGLAGTLTAAGLDVPIVALYNPLTLATERSVDHPNKQLVGLV